MTLMRNISLLLFSFLVVNAFAHKIELVSFNANNNSNNSNSSEYNSAYSQVDSLFRGEILFWADDSPLDTIVETKITPAESDTPVVIPSSDGSFEWDTADYGVSVNISRDLDTATSVMQYINGYDAYLTSLFATMEKSYHPNAYQVIAMDINQDGFVRMGDISQIMMRAVDKLDFLTDWFFVWYTTRLTDPSYRVSTEYPSSDGVGYSRLMVPAYTDDIELYIEDTTLLQYNKYHAVMLGDIDGSYADNIDTTNQNLIMDLESAHIDNNYIDIPVIISSSKNIHSIDFHLNFDTTKIQFDSFINNQGLEYFVNPEGSSLKLSSYSIDPINMNDTAFFLRFSYNGDIYYSDLDFQIALLNGKLVDASTTGEIVYSSSNKPVIKSKSEFIYPNPTNNEINFIVDRIQDVAL